METAKRITVSLPPDVYAALMEEAEISGRTVSDLVRVSLIETMALSKWENIGQIAERAIRGGATNQEALEQVRERFPQAGTSPSSIAWYRSRLRKDGIDVPTDAQARRLRRRGGD